MVIKLGTVEAQLGTKLKTLGHSWGTVGAQLRQTSWGTVEARLGHSWGTISGKKREKLATKAILASFIIGFKS